MLPQVATLTLNFTLVITPIIAPASISTVTAITGDKKSTFAQGELITIWGTSLSLAEGGHWTSQHSRRSAQDGSTESRSAAFDINIVATSPTLLGNSQIPVFLQDVTLDPSGNTFVTASTPAHPGDALIIYATGLGLTNPPLGDGVAGVVNVTAPITIMVRGVSAPLLGAVSSPQFPGLFQIAFERETQTILRTAVR